MREAVHRLICGPLLGFAMLVLAALLPLAILLGRRTYVAEAGSAASCLLNAITGGPRTVTFSAWAWQRYLQGKPGARWRVSCVNAINIDDDHCRLAWLSHSERGLL